MFFRAVLGHCKIYTDIEGTRLSLVVLHTRSSVGRALDWHAKSQGFDSHYGQTIFHAAAYTQCNISSKNYTPEIKTTRCQDHKMPILFFILWQFFDNLDYKNTFFFTSFEERNSMD